MSVLIYNGVSIDVLRVSQYEVQPVFHHHKYLYTRHRIHVTGIINPQATSYQTIPPGTVGPVPGPTSRPGTPPGMSLVAIRFALNQPRKPLQFWVGSGTGGTGGLIPPGGQTENVLILSSPPGTGGKVQSMDANNGPTPLYARVSEVLGTKTFRVEFGVETYVNDSVYGNSSGPIMISNVWTMSTEFDESLREILHYQGECVFDTGRLALANLNIDQFRPFYTFSVPPGFRRTKVAIQLSPDNRAVRYDVIDSRSDYIVNSRLITDIQGYITYQQNRPGGEKIWADLMGTVGKSVLGATGHFVAGRNPHGTPTEVASRRFGAKAAVGMAALEGAFGAAATFYSNLPTTSVKAVVKVVGRPRTSRADVARLAWGVLENLVGNYLYNSWKVTTSYAATHNIFKNEIQVEYYGEVGPGQTHAVMGDIRDDSDVLGTLVQIPATGLTDGTNSVITYNQFALTQQDKSLPANSNNLRNDLPTNLTASLFLSESGLVSQLGNPNSGEGDLTNPQ